MNVINLNKDKVLLSYEDKELLLDLYNHNGHYTEIYNHAATAVILQNVTIRGKSFNDIMSKALWLADRKIVKIEKYTDTTLVIIPAYIIEEIQEG